MKTRFLPVVCMSVLCAWAVQPASSLPLPQWPGHQTSPLPGVTPADERAIRLGAEDLLLACAQPRQAEPMIRGGMAFSAVATIHPLDRQTFTDGPPPAERQSFIDAPPPAERRTFSDSPPPAERRSFDGAPPPAQRRTFGDATPAVDDDPPVDNSGARTPASKARIDDLDPGFDEPSDMIEGESHSEPRPAGPDCAPESPDAPVPAAGPEGPPAVRDTLPGFENDCSSDSAIDGVQPAANKRDMGSDIIDLESVDSTPRPVPTTPVKGLSAEPGAARPIEARVLPATGGEAPTVAASLRDDGAGAGGRLVSLVVNGMTRINLKANATRVEAADPQIADVRVTSPKDVLVIGKGVGATQVLVQQGETFQAYNVVVEPNNEALAALIKSVVPAADVRIRSVNGRIVLTGRVPDTESAARIADLATNVQGGVVVNHLQVAGLQQTMLRVVVAEVSKSALRELGVNWGFGASPLSRDFFFANNVNGLNPTVFGSSGLANVRSGDLTYSLLPNANGGTTNFTLGFPRIELQMFLDALRENSLARVLAEPNLVAMSGQTATFLAGGEVPIPVTQGGAVAGAIVIEYKEFGVRLAFTPTVMGHQRMRLHVMSEVSDAIPTNQAISNLPVFTFTTRRVESTIECGNGQTFALAGLLNDRVNVIASKIPGIGDVPVLGALFSSTNYQRQQTELVVLVTPELVEPVDPGQVPVPPGADYVEPNDWELFGLQQLEGAPRPRRRDDTVDVKPHDDDEEMQRFSGAKLIGPGGFADADVMIGGR